MRDARRHPAHLVPLIVADTFQLAGQFRSHGEAIAKRVGQTQARWQVLSAASAERKTVSQIARRLGVSRQNVQRIADLLVREGWAIFEPNPDHRISPYLVLSDKGSAALDRLTEAAAAYHMQIAERISPAELQTAHRGLRRLIAALDSLELITSDQV